MWDLCELAIAHRPDSAVLYARLSFGTIPIPFLTPHAAKSIRRISSLLGLLPRYKAIGDAARLHPALWIERLVMPKFVTQSLYWYRCRLKILTTCQFADLLTSATGLLISPMRCIRLYKLGTSAITLHPSVKTRSMTWLRASFARRGKAEDYGKAGPQYKHIALLARLMHSSLEQSGLSDS